MGKLWTEPWCGVQSPSSFFLMMILWIVLMDCKGHRLEIRVGTRVAAAADNTVLREQRPDQNIQMRVASVEEESGVWL